jgi:hypothetical protein
VTDGESVADGAARLAIARRSHDEERVGEPLDVAWEQRIAWR